MQSKRNQSAQMGSQRLCPRGFQAGSQNSVIGFCGLPWGTFLKVYQCSPDPSGSRPQAILKAGEVVTRR
jgi:hypothetical protein